MLVRHSSFSSSVTKSLSRQGMKEPQLVGYMPPHSSFTAVFSSSHCGQSQFPSPNFCEGTLHPRPDEQGLNSSEPSFTLDHEGILSIAASHCGSKVETPLGRLPGQGRTGWLHWVRFGIGHWQAVQLYTKDWISSSSHSGHSHLPLPNFSLFKSQSIVLHLILSG